MRESASTNLTKHPFESVLQKILYLVFVFFGILAENAFTRAK